MTTSAQSSWLPNLVGNVSIWKLAVDLNEPRFFDGRLLVPETEGSDRLPASVTWNVQGMIPLAEARAKFPEQTAAAIRDFAACVEKVRAELSDPASGYKKYKDAFSVPALDAASDNYFYSPSTQKLLVTNWGASPRSIAGSDKIVFGYDAFGAFVDHAQKESAAGSTDANPLVALGVAQAVATGAEEAPAAAAVAPPDAKKDEKKKEEKKDDKERPWWIWLLLVLALGALIALILFLLKSCEQHKLDLLDGGADANANAGADGAILADGAANGQMQDGGNEAGADASTDGGANAGDAGSSDAGKDGGRDGGKDGGAGADGQGGGAGGGSGAGGGGVIVLGGGSGSGAGGKGPNGQGGGAGDLAHRVHVEPKAVKWRVVSGKDALDPSSPTEGDGTAFDIALKPGHSGEGVKVQWQDGEGKWHNF